MSENTEPRNLIEKWALEGCKQACREALKYKINGLQFAYPVNGDEEDDHVPWAQLKMLTFEQLEANWNRLRRQGRLMTLESWRRGHGLVCVKVSSPGPCKTIFPSETFETEGISR